MKELNELVEFVKKCAASCPWCKEQTVESYIGQVKSELDELQQAILEKDSRNISEELGDLLWDVVMIVHIAEHKGILDSRKVMESVTEKMKRRKPYIVSGKEVTIGEAMRIWNEQKHLEKR